MLIQHAPESATPARQFILIRNYQTVRLSQNIISMVVLIDRLCLLPHRWILFNRLPCLHVQEYFLINIII
jgi:hypothetical protein